MIELNMAKFNVKNPQTGEYEPLDGASQAKIQSDWNQTDNSAEDFIKNKPNIPSGVVVDQVYDGTSVNAQSGVAIAGALSDKVDKVTGKGLSTNDFTDAYKTELDGLDIALDGKVDKETGKGLSTNDFTTPEKTKLNDIESGAQVNVQVDWNQTDVTADDYIKNKPNIPSGIVIDTTYDATSQNAQAGVAVAQAVSTKVDKVTGKGLSENDYTTAEKDKLAGIASGAEVNVQSDWSQSDSTADDYIKNKPTIPTVNDAALTIQKNGTAVGTFSANAATAATINITVPVDAEDVDALPDTTKYGASLVLNIDSSTYVVTAVLKDQDGNTLGMAQTIDLPLETVVVGGSYDDTTKKVVLTLKNGNTIDFSVADLVAGLQTEITSVNKLDADLVDDTTSVHKFVTAAEKSVWNAKSDFSGDYDDLTNKPTIPAAQVNADWNATSGVAQILNKPTIPAPITVDQTYNAQSANAQSGVAIESKKPGLKTAGTQYTIDGETVTASTGAEAFNDLEGNKAVGVYSHAEGSYSTASGEYSHAEGHNTIASGAYSHAEGQSTEALGMHSHVEGYDTTASARYSHAEGYDTTASGAASHAEGQNTTASGTHSHAEGLSTDASGDFSHAEGFATTAASQYQHVQGKYNVADYSGTYAFIIGNGTGGSSGIRHNAFAIDWDGLIYVNGATTGVDVSAFPSPADINTAITKANAAAPQSTTYTMAQTDTLLGGKLDTSVIGTGTASTGWNNCRLSDGKIQYYNTNTTYSAATTSSSGLMSASDKQKLDGIAAGATNVTVDTDLSSTSTNPVQNKAVQVPIAQLVDAGAKNLLHFDHIHVFSSNGVSFTVNSDGTISTSGTATGAAYCTLTLGGTYETDQVYVERFCDGNHMLAGCPAGGNYSSGYSMYAAAGSYNKIDTGNGVLLTFTGTTNIVIVIMIRQGTNANGLVFKPMICTTEDWAVSHTSVPYAMSNSELTKKVQQYDKDRAALVEIVDSGAKNMAPVATGSKSGQGYFFNNANSISKIASGDAVAISFDYELSDGQLSVQLTNSSGSVISSTAVYTPSGTTSGHRDAIVTPSADAYGYNAYFGGSGTAKVSNFMICSKAAWDISNTYQPYAPTNRELYEMIGNINTVLEEVL